MPKLCQKANSIRFIIICKKQNSCSWNKKRDQPRGQPPL